MGNEMGNNNTSGLKEEEFSTRVEDTKEVLKEENHVVAVVEDKDFHEKANGLATSDPERGGVLSLDKQLPREREQDEESEGLPLADSSLKVKAESNEGDDESSENQVSLSNTTERESVVVPNLEKIVAESSENQLPGQTSAKQEEEGGIRNSDFDKKPTTLHDPETEEPAYPEVIQQELAIIHDESSLPDTDGTEQDLGPILTIAGAESGRQSEAKVAENLEESVETNCGKKMDESVVEQKALQEDIKELCEEKLDGDKFKNELSNATPPSCEKIDEGLTRDVHSESESETVAETNLLKPDKEATEKTEEKCLVLTEENRLIGIELQNGEQKHENKSSQPCEDIVDDLGTEDLDAIQSESIAADQKDEVNPSSDEVVNSHIYPKEEESKEKRIVEEGEENMETLYSIELDQAEEVQFDYQKESVISKNGLSIKQAKQDSCDGEFLATQASSVDSTDLIAQIIVSMNELAVEKTKQDVKQSATEARISSKTYSSASARESVERFSTDSEADNMSVLYDQMRKSPSFSLDLQTEAKTEESDQTPLLYQDKAAIQTSSPNQDDVISLGIPLTLNNGYSVPQDQEMTVQDKVVTLERSDSEKSKTPFLGFLKEEEEAHVNNVVTPQKSQEETKKYLVRSSSTKEITTSSASTKGNKEKRKARSYLFGKCMCCAVIN